MPQISGAKAEALMGSAFRARFDKETFYALLKLCPDWEHKGEQMVRSMTRDYGGVTVFYVTLAKRKGTSGIHDKDVVDAKYEMDAKAFVMADERVFSAIGTMLAKKVNEQVEALYMSLD